MRSELRFFMRAILLTGLVACQDHASITAPGTTSVSVMQPQRASLDGLPGPRKSAHFFLLPPLAKAGVYTGRFDATLLEHLAIEICEVQRLGCRAVLIRLTANGSGSERLRLDISDEAYHANWKTSGAVSGRTYRLRFLAAATEIASVDVQLVSGKTKDDTKGSPIQVTHGSTLPIKFRVEVGAVTVLPPLKGGIVRNPDGNVTLIVPPDALDAPVGITVAAADLSVLPPIPEDIAPPVPGTVYELGPDGTTFLTPITITVGYDPAALDGIDAANLALYTYSATHGWEVHPSTVDTEAHSITASIDHFSVALAAPRTATELKIASLTVLGDEVVKLRATLIPAVAGRQIEFRALRVDPRSAAETYVLGSAETNWEGVATLTMSPASLLSAGLYKYTAVFNGDTRYAPSSATATLELIVRLQTELTVNDLTVIETNPITLTAYTRPSVPGLPVTFEVHDLYGRFPLRGSATTNADGVAIFASGTFLSAGPYAYVASFAGNDEYEEASAAGSLVVTPAPWVEFTASPVTAALGSVAILSATFIPRTEGLTIRFTAPASSGTMFLDAKTDAEGVAKAPYVVPASLAPGEYEYRAEFEGSATLPAVSTTATLTVTRIPTRLEVSSVTVVSNTEAKFTAELYPHVEGLTLCFPPLIVDGVITPQCAQTDRYGVAAVTQVVARDPGTYSFQVNFLGTALYAPVSATGTLTVTGKTIPVPASPPFE